MRHYLLLQRSLTLQSYAIATILAFLYSSSFSFLLIRSDRLSPQPKAIAYPLNHKKAIAYPLNHKKAIAYAP
ncbi:MAG: hypothetical protein WCP16_01015 [Pseudanabaena sp. ELA645]